MTPSPALLDIAGLSIRFGGLAALSDVDLAVGAGEIFALIGPNGAGKTTVFNIVTGLYRPLAGHVRFDGHDLLARAPHAVARLGVARTFQNTEVFRGLSALDNVLIGAHPRLRGSVIAAALGLPSVRQEEAWARARAHALLARMGLGEAAGRDAAGARAHQPRDRPQRSALAAAVGAEQGHDLAGTDRERHAVQRASLAIGDGHRVEREEVTHQVTQRGPGRPRPRRGRG